MPHSDPPVAIVVLASDEHARRRICDAVGTAGWQVVAALRLAEAEHAVAAHRGRALLLEAEQASPELLRRLGRQLPTVAPVVWNATLPSEAVARLLWAGACDVLTARMSREEIHARLARAIGSSAGIRAEQTSMGELSLDTFRGETLWQGQRVPLTSRERDVLDVLMQEQGRTLRREVIYQRVWGHAMPAGDRNVDVNIKRLRSKLKDATGGCATVETISRVGYRLHVGTHQNEEARTP